MSNSKGKCPHELIANATFLGTTGKSILAIDESISTIKLLSCEDNEDRRRAYRELLLVTPGALRSLNGAVLSEEALYQKTADGKPFVDVLKESGVLAGIMIRGNSVALGDPDGLAQRFRRYHEAGARFAICGDGPLINASEPSQVAIGEKANELARFATYCQESGLVAIVYPKLSFDKPPSILKYADMTKRVLTTCLKALNNRRVLLEGTLLILGIAPKADPQVIARDTLRVLQRTVPAAIPTIVFLASGRSEEKAIIAMNKIKDKKPWQLSSFFGPPLLQRTLEAGAGKDNPHSPLDTRRAWKRTRGTNEGDLQLGEGPSKSPYHKY